MKQLVSVVVVTLVSLNVVSARDFFYKPGGLTCEVVSCQEVMKPVNASSWCDENDLILPANPSYHPPIYPRMGANVIDISDGEQVEQIIMGDVVTINNNTYQLATYIDGYWWDQYYERYQLNLRCQ